ncbi:MAG: hypothetical protein WC477_04220 [Patescibacteria group bacterium]
MNNIVTIVLSALIGSGVTYWFGVRQLRTETEIRMKVEKYNNLIKYLRGFIGVSASSELKKSFLQEWETSWLYCSDDVFHAVQRMLDYARSLGKNGNGNSEVGKEILGKIIIAMRKDLLNKKTELTSKDFIFLDVYE